MHVSHGGVKRFALAAVLMVSPARDATQHPFAGEWVGGYQRGRNFVYLRLALTPRAGSLTGTMHVPFQLRRREPIGDLALANGEAMFSLHERDGAHPVRTRREGDELAGSVLVNNLRVPFRSL